MKNFKTFFRFIPALLVASVAVGQIVAVEDKVSIVPNHITEWGIEKLGPAYWPAGPVADTYEGITDAFTRN